MNEKFGYSTGDELLRKFGWLVKQTAEKTGIACRYIGDALTMIMPEISLQEANTKIRAFTAGDKKADGAV